MQINKVEHVWLDCDPGHDDAFAIMLASHNERLKLIGISTIAGNQSIQKTTLNAMNVLNICGFVEKVDCSNGEFCFDYEKSGLKIPLLQGCGKPLIRPGVNCGEIHGESGLETYSSTHTFPPIPQSALNYLANLKNTPKHFTTIMYECLQENARAGQKVTLVATGPLTNVALLLTNYPEVVNHISKIVLMGGALGVGNTGPVAEFNIQVDPDAAKIVFQTDLPIYMVPLEVTHTALVNDSIIASIKKINTSFSELMVDLLLFFKNTYKTVFYMDEPPLHDPCAIAFVIDPSIFEFRLMRVDVETYSHLSYGQTVCDFYNMSKEKKNVYVCLRMDTNKFWDLMIDSLRKANTSWHFVTSKK